MRITINNYAGCDLENVSKIVASVEPMTLEHFHHYMFYNKRFQVWVRKTKKGLSIDIHKND